MKHVKTYDNLNNEPQIGDYVCLELKNYSRRFLCANNKKIINFLNSNIGKIIKTASPDYGIEFEKNIPHSAVVSDHSDNIVFIDEQDIEYFSNNKEDCEIYMRTKEYNL